MRTFVWRYKAWIGVEGSWDPGTRTGSLDIVLLGMLIGVNVGVAIKVPAE